MRRELEVMRILRVPPLGKLVAEVNGERYQNLSEITDEKARRVLLAAIGELIDFAGSYQALVDAGVASPAAHTIPQAATARNTPAHTAACRLFTIASPERSTSDAGPDAP